MSDVNSKVLPKAVAVFIVSKDRIYLMKRSPKKQGEDAHSLPGQWSQHGGAIEEEDPSPLSAIVRETEEETGHLFEAHRFRPLGISRFGTVFFILKVTRGEIAKIECLEGEKSEWFTFSGLADIESFKLRQTAIAYFYATYPDAVKRMMELDAVLPQDFGLLSYYR